MTDKTAKPKAIKTLDDLSFDQRNANKGTALGQTMVEQSIERYGAGRSIVADKDGVVIGGNKTLQAAREQGLEVQVIRTKGEALIVHQREDLSLDEDGDARMLAYIDNRSSEVGLDWDADILKADIDDGLDLGDIFSDADLEGIGVDWGDPDESPEAQMDAAERLQEKWQVKDGDVWQIGGHRLMCGDSTSEHDTATLMDSQLAQMIFTDPPYGVDYTGGAKKRDRLANDHIGTDIYGLVLPLLAKFTDDKAPLYLWYADGHASASASASASAGFVIVAQIIWAKNHAQFVTSAHYKGKHEPCYYAHKKGKSARWYGDNNEVTLWEYDRSSKNEFHPTQKPLPIANRAISNSTAKGDSVVDLFLGGGTTMVAAEQLGRKCYGMEIEPKYCAVILERMTDMGLTPELVDNAREAKA